MSSHGLLQAVYHLVPPRDDVRAVRDQPLVPEGKLRLGALGARIDPVPHEGFEETITLGDYPIISTQRAQIVPIELRKQEVEVATSF